MIHIDVMVLLNRHAECCHLKKISYLVVEGGVSK